MQTVSGRCIDFLQKVLNLHDLRAHLGTACHLRASTSLAMQAWQDWKRLCLITILTMA
jgi:hypothetical protein